MPPLRIGVRVKGAHGELYLPDVDPSKPTKKRWRRKRREIFGQVRYSCGNNIYRVVWDDGSHGKYSSSSLQYVGEGPPLKKRCARGDVLGEDDDLPGIALDGGGGGSVQDGSVEGGGSNDGGGGNPSGGSSEGGGGSAGGLSSDASVAASALIGLMAPVAGRDAVDATCRPDLPDDDAPPPPLPTLTDASAFEDEPFADADVIFDTEENDEAIGEFWQYQKAVSEDAIAKMVDKKPQ